MLLQYRKGEQSMLGRALLVIAVWFFASPCTASQLLVTSTSARDIALSGSTVAEPRTPSAAMFSNPAGLVLFDDLTVDGTTAFSFANPRVDVSAPSTYDETSSVFVMSPAMGLAVPCKDSWRFGFSLYGTVGNKFDFGADPSAGVPDDFFSEAGVFTFGAGVAHRFGDRLSVGAAVKPLFGLLHNRYTLGGVRFKYRLNGPGIQGTLGLRWEPRPGLALGLGLRTPGRVWMDGTMPLLGSSQDVDLELEMPMQVFFGVSKHFGERFIVSLAGRWTDSSSFGDSMIEFEETDAADAPFVPRAKDEWFVSLGLEYVCSELLTLRLGVGHANAIVGDKGVSPLVFDTQDTRVGVGFSLNLDPWSIDFMAGHAFRGSRDIDADEALILPGRYSIDGQVAMLGVTWRH
jgi:long-subunit fatty acid transport protein